MRIEKFCLGILAAGICAAPGFGETVFNDIPTSLQVNDPNYSLPYVADEATQIGGAVTPDLSSGNTLLDSITVVVSNWAYESAYEPIGTSSGYQANFTMNLYDSSLDLLASDSITATIAWRPEPTGCTDTAGGSGFQVGGTGTCYGGVLQEITFAMPDVQLTAGDTYIYGLSLDDPTGPATSLNFALNGDTDTTTVGSDPAFNSNSPFYDTGYWDTSALYDEDTGTVTSSCPETDTCENLTAGTPGVFSQDTGWVSGGYGQGMVEFDATTPEPSTFGLIGVGLLAIGFRLRKTRR